MNAVKQKFSADTEMIYDNQSSSVVTRIAKYPDGSKEVIKRFSSPKSHFTEPSENIVDYEIFIKILNSVGINGIDFNSEFSLFDLLHDANGNIDLKKVRLLTRELQFSLKTISADQSPINTNDLINRSKFMMLILEGLTTILFYTNQKVKKSPRVYDIVIGPNYEVRLHLEYFEGQTVENAINLILENSQNPRILNTMQSALGAMVDATSAIDSTKSIHFDIAPSNIILKNDGNGRLIDLSISFVATEESSGLNEKLYSFNDLSASSLVTKSSDNIISEYSQLGTGRANYSGPANFPGRSLKNAKTSDSFSATLSCLDIVSLSQEIRDDITTAVLAVSVKSRNDYLDDLILNMSNRYSEFWSDRSEEAELLQAEFFLALRQIAYVGLDETIPTTPEGLVLPNLYEIKNSAVLIPMLIYSLYQCLQLDETTGKITIDENKLFVVRKIIDLCAIPTETFLEDKNLYLEYCRLITQEPLFSATKRSLNL